MGKRTASCLSMLHSEPNVRKAGQRLSRNYCSSTFFSEMGTVYVYKLAGSVGAIETKRRHGVKTVCLDYWKEKRSE